MTFDRASITTALPPLFIAPTDGHLESLVVEVLDPSSEPKSRNRFDIAITELFIKLIRIIPKWKDSTCTCRWNGLGGMCDAVWDTLMPADRYRTKHRRRCNPCSARHVMTASTDDKSRSPRTNDQKEHYYETLIYRYWHYTGGIPRWSVRVHSFHYVYLSRTRSEIGYYDSTSSYLNKRTSRLGECRSATFQQSKINGIHCRRKKRLRLWALIFWGKERLMCRRNEQKYVKRI